ncbi:MAG: hypothetical protein M3326_05605 [Actinomycetota bacterium]|nr:hypothetical protein [Actinomycetota bacterium]
MTGGSCPRFESGARIASSRGSGTRRETRRAIVVLASLRTAAGLTFAWHGAAEATTLYGRVPAGDCITGIAVVVNGVPLCQVVD